MSRSHKTALPCAESTISAPELERHIRGWLIVARIGQRSLATQDKYKLLAGKLLWFLKDRGYAVCGVPELREFFDYLSTAHEDGAGRWGSEQRHGKLRPTSIETYYVVLRTLFRFLVSEGVLKDCPMEKVPRPVVRLDQIQPFTRDQWEALLRAAKKPSGLRRKGNEKRDEAILLLLLDTGMRASELVSLRLSDLDLQGHRCSVLGKGNKRRVVYFGRATGRSLVNYLRERAGEKADSPVFTADRGAGAGEPLTRSGLLQLIGRLGEDAGVETTRCSPHTFRHTFAVEFLRNGGNVFALQTLLGHTSLTMSRRYAALADADCENQHRQFSPVDRISRRPE